MTPESTRHTRTQAAVIKTEADLAGYIKQRFGVVLPDVRVCRNHSTPWRAFADAYFAKHSVAVWKGSRGFAGKSFTLSLLATVEATTLVANINVLGGTGEQAQRVLEAMDKFWMSPNAPTELLASEPGKRETKFVGDNWVRALMASTASVRGPHPQRLRLDEVDEVSKVILDAAMGQTMAIGGVAAQTVLSSTHHYADGTMTEVLRRAKERGWPIHEWCWRECIEPHGWLPKSEVARKRAEVTEAMWLAEYDLQDPNPEGRAIVTEHVDRMFKRALGEYKSDENEEVVIEPPLKTGKYATGADWARKVDKAVLWTFRIDVRPMRLVAFRWFRRRPWPVMVAAFDKRVTDYPGTAAHDETGVGDVVAGFMESDALGVMMVGRERADLFTEYIAAIERDECEAPLIHTAHGAHKFASVDDLYGSGHPPDEIVAGALAYHASKIKPKRKGATWGR